MDSITKIGAIYLKNKIIFDINKSIAVKQLILENEAIIAQIEHLAKACVTSLRSGGKIVFAGNGGSFADAQHLSAELISRLMFDRAPLYSLALGTNSSAMSAIGNDYGYDKVFERELRGVANTEDVFIAISTSGNSANIMNAIKAAHEIGISTIAFTGKTGGKLDEICECLKIPSHETTRIQECHILIGHILCELIELSIFQNSNGK